MIERLARLGAAYDHRHYEQYPHYKDQARRWLRAIADDPDCPSDFADRLRSEAKKSAE